MYLPRMNPRPISGVSTIQIVLMASQYAFMSAIRAETSCTTTFSLRTVHEKRDTHRNVLDLRDELVEIRRRSVHIQSGDALDLLLQNLSHSPKRVSTAERSTSTSSVRTLERIASPIVIPMVPPSSLNIQCQYLRGEKHIDGRADLMKPKVAVDVAMSLRGMAACRPIRGV